MFIIVSEALCMSKHVGILMFVWLKIETTMTVLSIIHIRLWGLIMTPNSNACSETKVVRIYLWGAKVDKMPLWRMATIFCHVCNSPLYIGVPISYQRSDMPYPNSNIISDIQYSILELQYHIGAPISYRTSDIAIWSSDILDVHSELLYRTSDMILELRYAILDVLIWYWSSKLLYWSPNMTSELRYMISELQYMISELQYMISELQYDIGVPICYIGCPICYIGCPIWYWSWYDPKY